MCPYPLGEQSGGIARSEADTGETLRENPMFAYELHRMQHAELVRQADTHRLAREVARAARRTGRREPEGRVSALRDRYTPAA